MSSALTGKSAIITGAGRGIGAALCKVLVERGLRVFGCSRSSSELSKLADDIKSMKYPDSFRWLELDLAEEKSILKLFDESLEFFGEPQIIINNAAMLSPTAIEDLETENLDQVLRVNLRAPFLICREGFRRMKAGGSILNISSIGALSGVSKFQGFSTYVATKAALVGMTECLALEGEAKKIRVNVAAPGAVQTQMFERNLPEFVTTETPKDMAQKLADILEEISTKALTGKLFSLPTSMEAKRT